jgi:hypothetical protein
MVRTLDPESVAADPHPLAVVAVRRAGRLDNLGGPAAGSAVAVGHEGILSHVRVLWGACERDVAQHPVAVARSCAMVKETGLPPCLAVAWRRWRLCAIADNVP